MDRTMPCEDAATRRLARMLQLTSHSDSDDQMAPHDDSHAVNADATRHGLTTLISTTLLLAFGISMAAAGMLLAAGMWLER